MRMWMIPPKYLCNKHLNGEHGEIHKHRHVFIRKQSITNRIVSIVQIEPKSMKIRHDDLAKEMLQRGMKHESPYEQPDISYLPEYQRTAEVDTWNSYFDLANRCEECKKRIQGE